MEPTIVCPKCNAIIPLTESLAAPLIQAIRQDFEKRLKSKDAEIEKREAALRDREAELSHAKASLDDTLAARMKEERAKIASEEGRKAKQVLAAELDEKSRQITSLQEIAQEREAKLKQAQDAQADLLRKQRQLNDEKRELELTIERRVQEVVSTTRDKAKKEAQDEFRLRLLEREQTISSMQKQIEELKRKAEQGSEQLQGEVQEIELEALLTTHFPHDTIEPVPKGEFGGDVLQRVIGPSGQMCGTILWESKRTKNWSDSWLAKLRDDQRAAKAEVAIIVSKALPKTVESFDLLENVWVADMRLAVPVAMMLRQSLIELASARQANEGQHTKMEILYRYLTGPQFRQRVQFLVEAFSSMQDDFAREKRAITRQWAKREEQIERVMQATAGMYGDVQGILGKTLQQIEGLELDALESPANASG